MSIVRDPIIDDDGTGTTGTVWNAAWMTALYNRIDDALALYGPSATIPLFNISGPTVLRTFAFPDANATILTTNAVVTVAQGGTGLASYAVGDLPYASGATAISKLAAVAAGSYLRSGGVTTAPVWSTLTLPNAATQGDLFVATGANAMGVVADVAVGQVLTSGGVGAVPAWSASPTLTSLIAPTLLGGTGTTSSLTIQPTSGVGTTGADIVFKNGTNGGTERLRLTHSGLLTFGGIVAEPALKVSGSTLQVRFANDSNYTNFAAGPTAINGTAGDSVALRVTGSMNHPTSPTGMYIDPVFTNVYTAAIATGFSINPSFSLTGNAARLVGGYFPVPTVTLNGFTATEAASVIIDGAPLFGTNKYALFVRAGLSEFDGLVAFGGNTSAAVALKRSTTNLQVRLADDSGYATLDCLGLKASGAAGASFGPGVPASLTIVNGIVTAAS